MNFYNRRMNSWTTIPNLLSMSRLPLTVLLCVAIAQRWWPVALSTVALAALTDWLDGWWARRFHQQSLLGRNLDPLTDKVLICAAFIYFQNAGVGIAPWMVTVIVGRELLVTGLRGMVEASGAKFPADWFGKLKTVLQMAAILLILGVQTLGEVPEWMSEIEAGSLYAALAATVGSGVQYGVKAARVLR